MKRFVYLFTLILSFQQVYSQTSPSSSVANVEQDLKKLNVLGSVLYIAAHPDDENTRLLAYLAQERHYRTGYLSLTRGDGGQNLIGTEQAELLGAIRTQELLAARRMDGAEQFFSRANDFGFSKGPDETLKIWDREKVLSDIVWVIRNFRPDVMICRFPTTGEGGHGHHTSSAILAQEAFTAAADPKRFPEQLKEVKPWQVKRLLWNTFNFGSINTTNDSQLKVDVGGYNTYLGKSYGEIAAESRSNHKTQGFGSARQRGQAFEYFKTILGDAPQNDLMDGVNTTWKRVDGGSQIEPDLNSISKNFDPAKPQLSVPALVKVLGKVEKLSDSYWRTLKSNELNELIVACAGLWCEAYTADPAYALGEELNIHSQLINRGGLNISLDKLTLRQHLNTIGQTTAYWEVPCLYGLFTATKTNPLPVNELQNFDNKYMAGEISQPYYLESPHPIGTYTINNEANVGNPENPLSPAVIFDFLIDGQVVSVKRKLMYKYVDPARGEIYQPVIIAPAVTANIVNKDYIYNSQQPQTIQVKLKAFTKASGNISLKPIAGWKISPASIPYSDKNKGDEWTVSFIVSPTDANPHVSVIEAVAEANGEKSSLGFQQISYEHIPTITLFPPAQAKLVNIDLKTAGKKIGYIAGAGDLVPEALQQVGYEVHQLTENEVLNDDLSKYDAIITGVRAYNVSPRLVFEQPKLMDYVKNGGNLVVQYNNNVGVLVNPGPYQFTVVNQRVTDENAVVTFTEPSSPLLNYPNKIGSKDFDGWIQERGLYFVANIDANYHAPLLMNDPNEAPNKGSLITADYGKGRFVYTSLAFFRELPAGVPGAYRLFVNLLSNPKK